MIVEADCCSHVSIAVSVYYVELSLNLIEVEALLSPLANYSTVSVSAFSTNKNVFVIC